VRAASDFVGVSDTLPQISYYTYTIEVKNGTDVKKYSVSMSVRNITTLSTKSVVYVLFETNYPGATEPVFVREIEIENKIPDPIVTNSPMFGLTMAFISAFILTFTSGWIVNKATPQKELKYSSGDIKIEVLIDNNGVLKSLYFQADANTYIQIKRVIEPLYIYGAGALIALLFVVLIIVCAKRK